MLPQEREGGHRQSRPSERTQTPPAAHPDFGFLGETLTLKPVSLLPSRLRAQASPPPQTCFLRADLICGEHCMNPQSYVLRALHTRSQGPALQGTLPGCPGQAFSPSEIAPQASSTNSNSTALGSFGGASDLHPSQSGAPRHSREIHVVTWNGSRQVGRAGDDPEGLQVSGAEVWPQPGSCVLPAPWRLLCKAPHTWSIRGTSYDLSPSVRSFISRGVEFGRGPRIYRSVCVLMMRPQETW